MKTCVEFSELEIIEHGIPLFFLLSTRYFDLVQDEMGLYGNLEKRDEVKTITREFSEKILPLFIYQEIDGEYQEPEYDEQVLEKAWIDAFEQLEEQSLDRLICSWLQLLIDIATNFSSLTMQTDHWTYLLMKWATNEGNIVNPDLPDDKLKDFKIIILQHAVKTYRWQMRLPTHIFFEPEMDVWDLLSMKHQGTTNWVSNKIKNYHNLMMWQEVIELLDSEELTVLNEWGKFSLGSQWQSDYDLVKFAKKLVASNF